MIVVRRLLVLSSLLAACGSPKPPTPPAVEDAAPPVETTPAPVDTTDVGQETPDAAATAATAGTEPAPPSPAPAAPSAPADECTPAGVAFEQTVRPKLKECYREGKKKDPNLEGTVKITLAIDLKGKIKSIRITEKTLPDPVAQCMLKAVKATPFPDSVKCPDKNITVPITFPTPP